LAREHSNGFDVIHFASRRIWRTLPLRWWLAYGAAGLLLAHLLPVASWVKDLWLQVIRPNANYLQSALLLGIALAALSAALRRWMLEDRVTNPPGSKDSSSDDHHLLDDVPLRLDGKDELERTEFAETIAPLLVLPANAESIVVAIEAGWGEGKSSALSLIENRLKAHSDNPIIVRFNPWFVHSREQVVRSFFSHLIGAVDLSGEHSGEVVDSLQRYARMFETAVPGPIGTLATGLLADGPIAGSLADEKLALADSLALIGRPIVVMIDDIDRLPADDIRCIFQLVKIVCDFSRVSYLLAFDPVPVDKALRFDGLYKNGREYREKVVQLGIRLPRAMYPVRLAYFDRRIEQRISTWNFQFDVDDLTVLQRAKPLALRACVTPREMKRLLNAWCISCDMLRGEVNAGDVLLMEVLALRFPTVFNAVSHNQRKFAGAGLFSDDYTGTVSVFEELAVDSNEEQRRKQLRDEILKLHTDKSMHAILIDIVSELFPGSIAEETLS
jgi:hypothetical protein